METINKSLRILTALVEKNGARISELSHILNIPNSTVHAHLSALADHGLVQKEGDKYKIGPKFLYFSGGFLYKNEIYPLIESKVKYIAEKTGERTQFIIEHNAKAVYIFVETVGENAIQTDVRPGKITDLHATAAGKAILAGYNQNNVEAILDNINLIQHTKHTIKNREQLMQNLEHINNQGYAINDKERINKQVAIGVTINDQFENPIGAFSVSGPTHRINDGDLHKRLPNLLMGVAEEVELTIQYK